MGYFGAYTVECLEIVSLAAPKTLPPWQGPESWQWILGVLVRIALGVLICIAEYELTPSLSPTAAFMIGSAVPLASHRILKSRDNEHRKTDLGDDCKIIPQGERVTIIHDKSSALIEPHRVSTDVSRLLNRRRESVVRQLSIVNSPDEKKTFT